MNRCAKKRDLHVFQYALDCSDDEAREQFPPGLLCQCGAFTWAQLNAIERQFNTLEAMWAAGP